MNRVIKFRAWHKEAKQMIQGTPKEIFQWKEEGQPIEIMQMTGLTDKNGKEIYEGDIVNYAKKEKICLGCSEKECESKLKYSISKFCPECGKKIEDTDFITTATVLFKNGGFNYHAVISEDSYTLWKVDTAAIYIAWVEVIGNIYENPELLNA